MPAPIKTESKTSPMNLRVPVEIRELLETVARAEGVSLTRFVLLAIVERARRLAVQEAILRDDELSDVATDALGAAERAARASGLRF